MAGRIRVAGLCLGTAFVFSCANGFAQPGNRVVETSGEKTAAPSTMDRTSKALGDFFSAVKSKVESGISGEPTAPKAAVDPNLPTIKVGIGTVADLLDGTTDSFDLYGYLIAHPVQVKGVNIVPVMIDHASEAQYSVSGEVDGPISLVHSGDTDISGYSWDRTATLRLRRGVAKIADLTLSAQGKADSRGAISALRARVTEQLWRQVSEKLAEQIVADLQRR